MNLATIKKALGISTLAVAWKTVFGGKGAVADYLLDKANTSVAMLPACTSEKLGVIYERMCDIRTAVNALDWIVPASWRDSYLCVCRCYSAVLDTLADRQVTRDEIAKVSDAFKLAYANWRADDVPAR